MLAWPTKTGGVSEDIAARGVIPMVMAIDDVLDRNFEAIGEFGLQPLREFRNARVTENDPLRGDQEHGAVVVVDCRVHATTNRLY